MSRPPAFTDAAARAAYRPGMSSYQLAAALGVSQGAAYAWMQRAGIKLGPPGHKVTGLWPAAREQGLRELWDIGLTAGEIGRQLGVSRNTVIGKAHRMNLDARPSPIRRSA